MAPVVLPVAVAVAVALVLVAVAVALVLVAVAVALVLVPPHLAQLHAVVAVVCRISGDFLLTSGLCACRNDGT